MKKILLILLAFSINSNAQNLLYGVKFSVGARYDNVRMCVATDKGTPGGPMADAALTIARNNYELSIPIFRPLLFISSFQMLQFEPELTWYFKDYEKWIMGLGLGIVFHYGPDFNHDKDDRGKEFFALGPKISYALLRKMAPKQLLGFRTFAGPLFSNYHSGIIIAGQIEYNINF